VGLEWGSLSLVSTVEELLGRKSSCSDLETEDTDIGMCHADHVAPSILKCWHYLHWQAAVSQSVSIVRSWTQATEFSFLVLLRYSSKEESFAVWLARC
jgi:hypothetical protein